MSMATAGAEEGDQILDGIGETGLIARYPLVASLQDASRNAWHGSLPEAGARFIDDADFGAALQASGSDTSLARLPAKALAGIDALTATGWWRWDGEGPRAVFLSYETAAGGLAVEAWAGGTRVTLVAGDRVIALNGPALRLGVWTHLAIVFDPARQTMALYLDGVETGSSNEANLPAEGLFPKEAETAGLLALGGKPGRKAGASALSDLRLYRVALTGEEVSRIHGRRGQDGRLPRREAAVAADGSAWSAAGLVGAASIVVETTQGFLPQMPRWVPGRYADGKAGPVVRVIWPAPRSNEEVAQPGSFIWTGRVVGTSLQPRATVLVRPTGEPLALPRTEDGADLSAYAGVVASAGSGGEGSLERKIVPFALGDVSLEVDESGRATPFAQNRDKFLRGLLASSPDSFLYMFRDAFGQPQPAGARPLGVWDSQTVRLRGHATGHYLTALAQAYASATHDPEARAALRAKMDTMVATLAELAAKSGRPAEEGGPFSADPSQVPPGAGRDGYDSDLSAERIRQDFWNWGEGYLSAYPPDQFIMLEGGATYGTGNHQVWAPYYTLDKILKGLLDCYEIGGDERALSTARGMGAWVHRRLSALPTEELPRMWNRYIAGEYGGINTEMARLYSFTQDERFLEAARIFDNKAMFYGGAERPHGLARNVDTIRGRHSNQHIPQIIGALRIHQVTGDPEYFRIAQNFWNISYHGYTYSIGGVAGARDPNNAECYTAEPDSLHAKGFSEGGQNETCATYNLLALTRELFMRHPDSRYMDYYERALYNQILASVAPESPANTYHVPLNPGARKSFGNPDMSGFTCCNGTSIDSNTKLQDSIFFRATDDSALYVNLFIPSTLSWRERQVTARLTTSYPYGETVRLTIEGSGRFSVLVRRPGWTGEGAGLAVNGEEWPRDALEGGYWRVERDWLTGDVIEVRLPFRFWLHRVMDQLDLASLFYGPVLLAVEESGPLPAWREVPWDPANLGAAVSGDPARLRFRAGDLSLKPFFEFGPERHSVYLKIAPGRQ
jgi:uncharacterized protein